MSDYLGKELSSILSRTNEIFIDSLKPEYKESESKLLEAHRVTIKLVEDEVLDWINRLRLYTESNDLHEKAFVLNYFDWDFWRLCEMEHPESENSTPYESIWSIPREKLTPLKNISACDYVSWLELENPLNYITVVLEPAWIKNPTGWVKGFSAYFDNEEMVPYLISFKIMELCIAPIKNNINLPLTADMIDWIVRLTKEVSGLLQFIHDNEIRKQNGYSSPPPAFDRKKHLAKAREKKDIQPKMLKLKAWELFESGEFGTTKKQAVLSMFEDLQDYAKQENITFWPENYNDFFYNKTLCRPKL